MSNDPEAATSNVADQLESTGNGELLPYRSTKGRIAAASSLLIPYGIMIIFIMICVSDKGGKYDLSSVIEVDTFLRVALIIHGVYFVGLPFSYEISLKTLASAPLFPKAWNFGFGEVPSKPDNLYWQLTCLSGELFFVASIAFFLMASQDYVARWTLLIPISQCAYNLKNDLCWFFLGNLCSPIYKRMNFIIVDTFIIAPIFIIYTVVFFI